MAKKLKGWLAERWNQAASTLKICKKFEGSDITVDSMKRQWGRKGKSCEDCGGSKKDRKAPILVDYDEV